MKYLLVLKFLFSTAAHADEELLCLATTIFRESANQPKAGQVAVGSVTLNRVNSKLFPNTVCKVVRQRGQFSWFRGGSMWNYVDKQDKRFQKALVIASSLLTKHRMRVEYSNVGNALFFHAVYVAPNWKGVAVERVIGDHVFYRKL